MDRNNSQRPRFWVAITALSLLGLGTHWLFDFVSIDSCLDSGYTYNYAEEFCDNEGVTHPVISYGERHPWVVWFGLGVGAIGVVGVAVSHPRIAKRARSS